MSVVYCSIFIYISIDHSLNPFAIRRSSTGCLERSRGIVRISQWFSCTYFRHDLFHNCFILFFGDGVMRVGGFQCFFRSIDYFSLTLITLSLLEMKDVTQCHSASFKMDLSLLRWDFVPKHNLTRSILFACAAEGSRASSSLVGDVGVKQTECVFVSDSF